MKRQRQWFRTVLFVGMVTAALWVIPSAQAQPETLTIAAANSLRDALRKVLPIFEAQHRAINVRVVYGPSQTLRSQIEQGAPVDVFLPSLFEEIEQLEKKGLIIQGTKRAYAGTSLVLITSTSLPAPIASIQDLRTVPIRRIAVGDPKSSAVGKVAAQFLTYNKLDAQLKSQYIFGEHSRAVLDLVAKGEAEVGVVYRTDAVLQVDGYAGFERLTAPGDIVLAACWAHARRKFYDLHEATGSPIAAEALRRIAELYAIERSIQGRTADARRHVRNTSARPLIEMMKPWLEMELGRVPPAGPLAEAIRYALARWPALTRFLDDGRIELDNNPVERAIRPIALGRKNHLFAGSDGGGVRWATVCSLIATAKLNNVEPFAWLRDVLQRMTDGHPASRLDELLPWNWQPTSAKA